MIDKVSGLAPGAGGAAFLHMAYSYLFGSGSRVGSTSASFSYQIEQSLEIVDSIAELKDGWAGNGSIAPSTQVIDFARSVVRRVCSDALFVDIAPMPNGTIAFDWETDEGCANLEIGETTYSFYLELHEGECFYPLSGPVAGIPLHLGEFISDKLTPLVPSAGPVSVTYARPRRETTSVSWGPMLAYV